MGGWVGPRAGLDAVARRKIPSSCRDSNPRLSSPIPLSYRIFGPNRVEVAGGWGRMHNEEPHNFYSSPNIIRVIKSVRMRCVGYVARISEMRNVYSVLIGNPEVTYV
jgi:hypothetical protein